MDCSLLLTKGTHWLISLSMKYFAWSAKKNAQLKRDRGVSFEEVVLHIERGDILDIVEHPNGAKYRGQRLFILDIGNYAWLVLFVESDEEVFLKTAIPGRKATKRYLGEEKV